MKELNIDETERESINRVLDLGGDSGTFYKWDENKNIFEAIGKKFMKEDGKTPNDFEGNLQDFITEFNIQYAAFPNNDK